VSHTHERGILALVPDAWDVAWQRRHQVLSRLAALAPVAWISPPTAKPSGTVRHNGMFIVDDERVRLLRSTEWVMRRRAERGAKWLRSEGCRSIEMQLWLPEYEHALDWNLHTTSSYHVDDE
jgi:hypothetical protein